jgi:hypothetical protein
MNRKTAVVFDSFLLLQQVFEYSSKVLNRADKILRKINDFLLSAPYFFSPRVFLF